MTWDQAKLQFYIDEQIEENINLDYKASGSLEKTDAKKNEIAKDVSAFANSDGGIIIYGMTENNATGKYLPENINPIDRNTFSKETLEQIINSRISPKIHGVKIHPVIIGDPVDNLAVYVVEIPQSNTAHQAFDKRYYRRYNFQSVAMDDWEVKDIINRQIRTQAKVTFRPRFPVGHGESWMRANAEVPMEFDIVAINLGQLIIHHIDFIMMGPVGTEAHIYNSTVSNGKVEHYFANETKRTIMLEGEEHVVNVQRDPILSHTLRVIGQVKFSSLFLKSDHKIRLSIVTDDNRSSFEITGKEIYETLVRR
ncbi:AlbA family DNA-binding domain-containing protein [Pedobacter sp. GR22-6]|uniref:AlbA family DNA-binding domain-containing protein n=1 Tax=Pedobacter sp. GR22-6 TaxID=3127957 RepID=UPI00307F3F99